MTLLQTLPKIQGDFLKTLGKSEFNQLLTYLQYQKITMITGWVQASNKKDFDDIEHIAQKFLTGQKVGGLKYGKYSSIHFLSVSQLEQMKNLVEFRI